MLHVLLDAWVCLRVVTRSATVPTLAGTLAVRVSGLRWGRNGAMIMSTTQGREGIARNARFHPLTVYITVSVSESSGVVSVGDSVADGC